MGKGLQLGSGRVIALGRLFLSTLFLTAIWIDPSQPAVFPSNAYLLLMVYVVVAAALVVTAWTSWYVDSYLAGPAHALDIAIFTIVAYSTAGDTSPYFIFCMFVLLAAAIRWGWRATALTAVLLTLLYVLAGWLIIASGTSLDVNRFATRAGYLVILSLILIWFGVNQWRAQWRGLADGHIDHSAGEQAPLELSLAGAMKAIGSRRGVLVWSTRPRKAVAIMIRNGACTSMKLAPGIGTALARVPFLYDLANDRALMRDKHGNLQRSRVNNHLDRSLASALPLSEGLAIPVVGEAAVGQLFLEGIRGLSADHLDLGQRIGAAVALKMQRHGLIKAAEESAESRSRLAVARDLHDSVVQFLAGVAFRLEAMKRSDSSGRDVAPELEELKDLVLQEQSELRSFITALRSGSHLELVELAADVQSLTNRLSRQWGVHCTFSVEPGTLTIPTRLHLETQQLVREAVANAVRHAGAKNVSVRLGGISDQLRLDLINDGTAYPKGPSGDRMPQSLRERVAAVGGMLEISRGMGVTKLSISLPISGAA